MTTDVLFRIWGNFAFDLFIFYEPLERVKQTTPYPISKYYTISSLL